MCVVILLQLLSLFCRYLDSLEDSLLNELSTTYLSMVCSIDNIMLFVFFIILCHLSSSFFYKDPYYI